ncbi:MAG: hypothetical protein F7C35_03970 [Desulfurococcales archaeon]|nr:hypothetical protein [Desulfurococcales archaeon]
MRNSGKILAAIVLITIITSLSITVQPVSASSQQNPQSLYPCSTCHQRLKVNADINYSWYHGVDLRSGAHKGLMCSNCHNPESAMMELRGNISLAILGVHNRSQLMADNLLCAQCHAKIYKDYLLGAHGNRTFDCPNGQAIEVKGYKGVKWVYHICDDYTKLKQKPARACVECHNPHDPTYYAISILPPPEGRVPPPDESSITYGGIAVLVTGLVLIAASHFVYKKEHMG